MASLNVDKDNGLLAGLIIVRLKLCKYNVKTIPTNFLRISPTRGTGNYSKKIKWKI